MDTKKSTVRNYILQEIYKGNLKPGDAIPTEAELVKMFGYGRQTVHACLKELSIEGIIDRTAGKGSFVSIHPISKNLVNFNTFTQEMENKGLKPGATLLEYKTIKAKENEKVKKFLQLEDEDEVLCVLRLRTGDDKPIEIHHTYTPKKYVENIDPKALSGSFRDYFESKGLHKKDFYTAISMVKSTEEQRKLLNVDDKVLMHSFIVIYTDNKKPLQITSCYSRGDIYEFVFSTF